MSKNNVLPSILLDSDVIRHFIAGGRLLQLTSIFPGRFVMLEKVKSELCRSKSLELQVNNLLTFTKIPVIPFPTDINVIREYAQLIKKFGEGESACMAVAKYSKQYIASSNLKDIKAYCIQNSITYLTTMDILVEAFLKKIMTEAECDQFIHDVLAKGSKLPCKSLQEYLKIAHVK